MANCVKENYCLLSCHPKLQEGHPCPVDPLNLDCIKVIPQNNSGTPITKTQGEEGPVGHHRIHRVMIYFCLIYLSITLFDPFPLSFSLSHVYC